MEPDRTFLSMGDNRFDQIVRSLTTAGTRRSLLGFLATLPLVSSFAPLLDEEVAAQGRRRRRKKAHKHGRPRSPGEKKRRQKNKKIKRNTFGCVDVGSFCKNSGQCCSGICQGKKGKKKCRAHDAGTCQAGQDQCLGVEAPCTTTRGGSGICATTTGKASYCFTGGICHPCSKDVECEAFFGDGAACIVCEAACQETGGTECVENSPPF